MRHKYYSIEYNEMNFKNDDTFSVQFDNYF